MGHILHPPPPVYDIDNSSKTHYRGEGFFLFFARKEERKREHVATVTITVVKIASVTVIVTVTVTDMKSNW